MPNSPETTPIRGLQLGFASFFFGVLHGRTRLTGTAGLGPFPGPFACNWELFWLGHNPGSGWLWALRVPSGNVA